MQPLSTAPKDVFASVEFILTDLDDTVTFEGRLPAASYAALEDLEAAGKHVVIVTGRPADWCDLIARFFPVSAVVGENGAFYFRYDHTTRTMHRVFQRTDQERQADRVRLDAVQAAIIARYPHVRLSADQGYRISDVAIDFCEDVPRLDEAVIADVVAMLEAAGATAKVSSIHVNAWIGDFSKLEMSLRLLSDAYGISPDVALEKVLYIGDSPNDQPMFAYFRHTVGVANLAPFVPHIQSLPAWITHEPGGFGFAEVTAKFLQI